jgi:ubiquinone/menaquinone biosynthesis C-methylase UbiE
MKQGDFTELAKAYINRPAYSQQIILALLKYIDYDKIQNFKMADVGAGTGKMTKVLLEMGLNVTAVEPNDEMRNEGILYTKDFNIQWLKGNGEETNLSANTFDWVSMASSFHWTDPSRSLPEFNRVLKKGGYFTAIWNPRNIESSPLHMEIEDIIYKKVPSLQRVSSGGKSHTKKWEEVLISTGHFADVIFMEVDHVEKMTIDRYMGAWRSVNDIRAQAGEKLFAEILIEIENKIKHLPLIEVPYKMRAWTARKVK